MHRAFFTLILAGVSFYQTNAAPNSVAVKSDAETRPVTQISVVALGPKPSRKYREVAGSNDPVMLLAKPGETPPSQLFYRAKSEEEKRTAWQSFNVSFNNPSAMKTIEPGKTITLFRKLPGGDDNYQEYVTIPAGEEGSRRLFFLTPSVTGPTLWDKPPTVHTISLNDESLKDKQFILKNLSDFTVQHAFDDSVVSVEPTKIISYKQAKTGQLYQVAARYGAQKKIIYNTGVRLNSEGHIQLYVLYNANPHTNSSRSVGVFRTMIPAAPDPQPVDPSGSTP